MPLTASYSDHVEKTLETCLIVDDDDFDRDQIKQVVRRDRPDMQTFEFSTLSDAKSYLKTAGADLILLDNRLPDGEGAVLAAELRRDPRHANTPIIVVTGDDVSTLAFDITALSKQDFSARNIGELVADFLKARRIARGDDSAKLVEQFGMTVSENLTPVFSRAIRTLRAARGQVSRTAPFQAIQAIDEVEDMLMALARVLGEKDKRH